MLYGQLVFNLFIHWGFLVDCFHMNHQLPFPLLVSIFIHICSPIYNVVIVIIVTEYRLFEMFESQPGMRGMKIIETWLALWILLSAHWDNNIWALAVRNINLCVYKEQQMLNLKSYHHRHHIVIWSSALASFPFLFLSFTITCMKRWKTISLVSMAFNFMLLSQMNGYYFL